MFDKIRKTLSNYLKVGRDGNGFLKEYSRVMELEHNDENWVYALLRGIEFGYKKRHKNDGGESN